MFKGLWCCFCIKYIFGQRKPLITKKSDDHIENKDIPQQSFLDVGNILLEQGGIDLLEVEEQTDNTIIENSDIPEQSFLDLGKILLENKSDNPLS
jgi:hypothetical protein